jgi:hypothetical protein
MNRILLEVIDDSATLVMEDGSRWALNPGDMPRCCTWPPTAPLDIKRTSAFEIFPYTIVNREAGVSSSARPLF